MKKLKNKKSIIALFVYTLLYVLLFNEKLFANVSFNVNVNSIIQVNVENRLTIYLGGITLDN